MAARHAARVGRERYGLAAVALAIGVLLHLLAAPVVAAGPALTGKWGVGSATAEGAAELTLAITLERGWHLNAHDPDRPYLIPTVLEIDAPAGTKVESIQYPEAVVRSLAFAPDMPLRLYESSFTITVRMTGPKPERFDARLSYQACNEEKCLPPSSLPFPFDRATAGAKPARLP